jgi:biofilm PGA synthesis protein PgaA
MSEQRLRFLPLLLGFACTLAIAEPPAALAEKGDWAAALGGWQQELARNPEDKVARRGAFQAAMRLGLFEQANALAAPLSDAEHAGLEGDRIALLIRYGRIDAQTMQGPQRYSKLDTALAATAQLEADFRAGKAVDTEATRRLVDRVAGLSYRNRPDEAVALFEAMVARGIVVPAWALNDVAGAYLSIRRPQESLALYRKVLAAMPDDFDANFGLFYALVECELPDEATAHIDAYAARLPARRHRDGQPNGERWSAVIATDQARLYADRLAQANQRIDEHVTETPNNSEARSAEASLHLMRGWPRLGEADLRRNIGRDPENASLHADRAEALLTLQRWAPARASLATAESLAPDSPSVRRARESLALHDRHELYIEAGYGEGAAQPYGSKDWHVDSWLYSKPFAENWRAFTHNFTASADFDGSYTRWTRTGVGLEWRAGDWRATGEVNGGEGEKAGFLASLRWQLNDYWQAFANAETVTNEIPMQAVRAGITAKRAGLGIEWRENESRRLSLGSGYTDFSDGNNRNSLNAAWFERWLSGPRWSFETTLGVDATHNSLGYAAAYFNPPNDRSTWLTGAVEQLVWRDYDRSFRHRLALTAGSYWQQDFGSAGVQAIEYTHRWELDRDLSLRYGVGRSLRPYDGNREARNMATLVLLWRF